MSDKKNVAIIGAGLQANRRIPPIVEDPNYNVSTIIDLDIEKAKKLALPLGASVGTDWREVIDDPNISVVLVLTYPDSHGAISIEAMKKGKDVLCEKPLTQNLDESYKMVETAQKTQRILKCGFNHRHHPAVLEAHKLFSEGLIGKATFGRGRYGIAGREGLEKEWRSDTKYVSGGQMMEQGVHLVDLFRWFFGDMNEVTGMMSTTKWPIQPLEDNGFILMRNKDGVISSIHSSLTQWINLFEFEIYGEMGHLAVSGLGGSYGVEKLQIGVHDPNGPFSYKTIEFRGGDKSWKNEWEEFTHSISTRNQPIGNGQDGLEAIRIVSEGYKKSLSISRND